MFKTFKTLKEFLQKYEDLNSFNNKLFEISGTIEDINSKIELTKINLEKNLLQSEQLTKIILNLENKASSLEELNGKVLNYQEVADKILDNKETLKEELKEINIIKEDNENLKNEIKTIKNEYVKHVEDLKKEHSLLNEDMEKINIKTNELSLNIANLLESLNNFLD